MTPIQKRNQEIAARISDLTGLNRFDIVHDVSLLRKSALRLHRWYLQTDPRGGTLYVNNQPLDAQNYHRAVFIA